MTSIGRALRQMRFDRQELLKDMAAKLEVSSAFLSAIENGRKKVPANFIDKVCKVYNLNDTERALLIDAVNMSTTEIKINLTSLSPSQHEAALSFAKALNGLTDSQVQEIMRVFEKRKKR
ncbi:MAG: helix-turn-helix domain-containing protein [Oscillospiraceae bacterium]|nr:helix-turn-helix domain-containing protein [Oscillospiraceae bacterium]